MRLLCVLLACVGCSADRELAPVAELVHATDRNPDPSVVEIDLTALDTSVSLRGDAPTQVLAYRDDATGIASVPGPMIEAKRGDRLIVHFTNAMADRSTTVHWHGLRLPIEMDGDPMVVDPVAPGGSYTYDFTLEDAGLFWYHPHVDTDEQIELGLQGILLVHDTGEPRVDADRVLVLDDIDFDGDAIRIEPSQEDLALGRRGDALLVNGREPGFVTAPPGAVERWRIVNTSNGRFFDLAAGTPLRVIGWDGGLVADPYEVDHLVVAPGERYDVLVLLDRTRELVTREVPRGDGMSDAAASLVRFDVAGEPVATQMPTVSATIERLVAPTQVRRFVLREELAGAAGSVFFINDERWPFNVPLDVSLGATETWELVNENDHEHPFHIHGHFAQVIGDAHLGWKDTIRIPAQSSVSVVLRYETPGKWMAHCQIPEHAERGMTADINVMP
jgi:FtsP/CotA-like multicopper oxidase with cupredoxin domain